MVPNGSPYEHDKLDQRMNIAVARQTENDLPIIYVNQVGGQDELVFDGGSFVLDKGRQLRCLLPAFGSKVVTTEWHRGSDGWHCRRRDRRGDGEPGDDLSQWLCWG